LEKRQQLKLLMIVF